MLVPFQLATSSRTLVVSLGDLGDLAAHDPGDARAARSRSQTRTVSGSSDALDPVQGGHRLALAGRPHGQGAAGHLVEVEGVQGLGGQQHHVVGDVDDVVDRPLPGRREARLQPERRGRDRDVGEDAGA